MEPKLEIDAEALMSFMVDALEKQQDIYGPVFPRMIAKYAVEFESKKIKDSSPPQVENLEQARDYITKNLDKYPDGFASLLYGTALAIDMLEGKLGSGARSTHQQSMKELAAKTSQVKTVNTAETYKQQIEILKSMHLIAGEQSVSGDGESATVKTSNCHFWEACDAIAKKGIRVLGGGFECVVARGGATSTELATGTPHDFELIEFKPPNCVYKLFRV